MFVVQGDATTEAATGASIHTIIVAEGQFPVCNMRTTSVRGFGDWTNLDVVR